MVDSVQIAQDILKMDVRLEFNPDPLRKLLVDILLKNKELEDRIKVLEDAP